MLPFPSRLRFKPSRRIIIFAFLLAFCLPVAAQQIPTPDQPEFSENSPNSSQDERQPTNSNDSDLPSNRLNDNKNISTPPRQIINKIPQANRPDSLGQSFAWLGRERLIWGIVAIIVLPAVFLLWISVVAWLINRQLMAIRDSLEKPEIHTKEPPRLAETAIAGGTTADLNANLGSMHDLATNMLKTFSNQIERVLKSLEDIYKCLNVAERPQIHTSQESRHPNPEITMNQTAPTEEHDKSKWSNHSAPNHPTVPQSGSPSFNIHESSTTNPSSQSSAALYAPPPNVDPAKELAAFFQDAFHRNDRLALQSKAPEEMNVTTDTENALADSKPNVTTRLEIVKGGGSYFLIHQGEKHWLIPTFATLRGFMYSQPSKGIFSFEREIKTNLELRLAAEVKEVGSVWEVVSMGVVAVPA
jgi:hypothetical protein